MTILYSDVNRHIDDIQLDCWPAPGEDMRFYIAADEALRKHYWGG